MMKIANPRQSDNSSSRRRPTLRWASHRRVAEPSVDPISIAALDVLAKEPPQVALVDHDHVVHWLASNRPDPAISGSVLPRAPIGGPLRFNAELIDRPAASHDILDRGVAPATLVKWCPSYTRRSRPVSACAPLLGTSVALVSLLGSWAGRRTHNHPGVAASCSISKARGAQFEAPTSAAAPCSHAISSSGKRFRSPHSRIAALIRSAYVRRDCAVCILDVSARRWRCLGAAILASGFRALQLQRVNSRMS